MINIFEIRRKKMTTLTLFIILLIVGLIFMIMGIHTKGMSKVLLIIMGLLICVFGLFGIVTSIL